jgi:hypothetical protein
MDALKTIAAALRIEATQQAVDAVRCREVGHHEIAVSADGASRALLAAARILERVGGQSESKVPHV